TSSTSQSFSLRPIRSDADLTLALERIRVLRRAAPGSPEEDQLDVLSSLVHDYEQTHHPIEPPTALEAIKFRLDQGSLTKADLLRIVGSRSRLSELLAGKRSPSLRVRKELHARHGLPASALLRDLEAAVRAQAKTVSRRVSVTARESSTPSARPRTRSSRRSRRAPPRGGAPADPRSRPPPLRPPPARAPHAPRPGPS